MQFLFEDAQSRLWCAGTGTLGYFQDDEFHDLVPRYVERYGGLRRRLAARPRDRGVADVLFGDHDFQGRLSFSWPPDPGQNPNRGDTPCEPLFPYGFGRSYTG